MLVAKLPSPLLPVLKVTFPVNPTLPFLVIILILQLLSEKMEVERVIYLKHY
jgi:hypothetical protein